MSSGHARLDPTSDCRQSDQLQRRLADRPWGLNLASVTIAHSSTPWVPLGFLCRLIVNTGCAGVTSMVMHAQSHAQALIAAQELFPACQVQVMAGKGRDPMEAEGNLDEPNGLT